MSDRPIGFRDPETIAERLALTALFGEPDFQHRSDRHADHFACSIATFADTITPLAKAHMSLLEAADEIVAASDAYDEDDGSDDDEAEIRCCLAIENLRAAIAFARAPQTEEAR